MATPVQKNLFRKLIGEEILASLSYSLFYHWLLKNKFTKLAEIIIDIKYEEDEHIQELTERAFELDFVPDYTLAQEIISEANMSITNLKDTVNYILTKTASLEADAVASYKDAIKVYEDLPAAEQDTTTLELFKHILSEEEKHFSDIAVQGNKEVELGLDYLTVITEAKRDFVNDIMNRQVNEFAVSNKSKKLIDCLFSNYHR